MQITIVSPLFPPDVAVPAPYVKELAKRLALHHKVTVLTYSHLPEAVANAAIVAIEKQDILPRRLTRFLIALYQQLRSADVVIVQNGISSELPLWLCTFFSHPPFILEVSDPKAVVQNEHSSLKRFVHNQLKRRATAVIRHTDYPQTLERPEIYSFAPYPQAAFNTYETAWATHLTRLLRSCKEV